MTIKGERVFDYNNSSKKTFRAPAYIDVILSHFEPQQGLVLVGRQPRTRVMDILIASTAQIHQVLGVYVP